MIENSEQNGQNQSSRRLIPWALASVLLLLPLLAMQFTTEVAWGAVDFGLAAVLLFGTAFAFELAMKRATGRPYQAAAGVALVAALTLVWISLGVGIIGADGDPANLLYLGVPAVGLIGAILARFQPFGMARALTATAIAQTLVLLVALVAPLGRPYSGPLELILLNGFFIALFVLSAGLFRRAAGA